MEKYIHSIGLGPGDPELITLKAKRLLEESDIIVTPQSDVLGKSVAREIVLNFVEESKLMMYYFPMNNDSRELDRKYGRLAGRILDLLDRGGKVSFVTMGDPTIFSTSNYLSVKLAEKGVLVRNVPGINTVNGTSALLGLPLCVKGENFGVYEMPQDVSTAVKLIRRHPTTVFMKVNKKLPTLMEAIEQSHPQAAYLAQKIGLEGEAVYNLLLKKTPCDGAYLSTAFIRRDG